jgi:hypothetical protein
LAVVRRRVNGAAHVIGREASDDLGRAAVAISLAINLPSKLPKLSTSRFNKATRKSDIMAAAETRRLLGNISYFLKHCMR